MAVLLKLYLPACGQYGLHCGTMACHSPDFPECNLLPKAVAQVDSVLNYYVLRSAEKQTAKRGPEMGQDSGVFVWWLSGDRIGQIHMLCLGPMPFSALPLPTPSSKCYCCLCFPVTHKPVSCVDFTPASHCQNRHIGDCFSFQVTPIGTCICHSYL